ncbi:MAG TPA: periplasmic heavy metal sensor [candidate division WOR-3 bacterium]|uniref:Periplasmic heavy metal sensor n=1 Tax=candidate division WOR-3 bacterium TaxID=2052148 RepID=A0A9C9EPJ6_UNCW3|nr:periplasmic heavy metal sensor [candidate division WOR-3 bacterium]
MKQIFSITAVLFIVVSLGFAQEGCRNFPPGQPPHGHRMMPEMRLEMLDLTASQRDEIEAARLEAQKKIIPLKAEIELKRLDLEKEMRADTPNRSKIMKLTEEINKIELKIKQTKLDEMLKIRSVLTPEQREELKKPLLKKIMKKKIIKKHCCEEEEVEE